MALPAALRRCGLLGLLWAWLPVTPAPGQEGPAPVVWVERIQVASGEAYQGTWQMNESRFRYVDDPAVFVDACGSIGVAWVAQLRKDIFFQRFTSGGREQLPKPTNVSRSARVFSWLPRALVDPGDPRRVHVLWQELVFSGGSHGGEIFFARSTDGGREFSRPVNLSKSRAGDGKGRLTRRSWHNGSLDLALGPDGTLYAAWTTYGGRLWLSRSTDGGERFSKPARIFGDESRPARGPSVAVGPGSEVSLAWTVGGDPAADIHVARSEDGGLSFGHARVAARSDGHADAPKLAVDRRGTTHLVYAESPTGPFERYRILYTRSTEGPSGFAEPREISTPAPRQRVSAHFPALALDGAGRLFVLWELFPDPAGRPRGLGYSVSENGDVFAPPSVVPGSDDPALGHGGGRQGLLMKKLALGPDGAVAVVHSTFEEGERSQVWLFRGRRAGVR